MPLEKLEIEISQVFVNDAGNAERAFWREGIGLGYIEQVDTKRAVVSFAERTELDPQSVTRIANDPRHRASVLEIDLSDDMCAVRVATKGINQALYPVRQHIIDKDLKDPVFRTRGLDMLTRPYYSFSAEPRTA